ncbi:MAG: methyltransferase domain-containing protein [Coleofasciculaceae cyanobacterium RL_1_1]|nr:methyltransferase domain-containing protein [Coleofasciculaceae cyanobacterium RL_1_1]
MTLQPTNQPINQSANWQHIDTTQSDYFIDYLDTATAQAEMQRYKQKTYDLIGAVPGVALLDIGCGTGDDAIALAQRVGATGYVVGLDRSEALIEEARRRITDDLAVIFAVGDSHNLPFSANSFDGCRVDRVFMHLDDPQRALSEAIRVTRPGGRILVRDPDWETLVIDCRDRDLSRRILNAHFDGAIRHSAIGRQLYRLFRQAGLDHVAVADTSTLVLTEFATADQLYGLTDAAERAQAQWPELHDPIEAWLEELQQADRNGQFFSAVLGFTVVGCKPISLS